MELVPFLFINILVPTEFLSCEIGPFVYFLVSSVKISINASLIAGVASTHIYNQFDRKIDK